ARRGARKVAPAPAARAAQALSLWPQPRRPELGSIDRTAGAGGGADRRRILGRAALPEPDLAPGDRRPPSGLAGLAAAGRRRIAVPLHQPAKRGRDSGRAMGPDADRLSPICERPGDLLRPALALSPTGVDEAAARPGRDPAS